MTGDDVRLRSGHGVNSTVVASMARGQFVGVLESKDGWTRVFPFHVYVEAERLDADNVVKPGGASLRLEPAANAPVLGKVEGGKKLEGFAQGSPYRQVQLPEELSYWMATSYVSTDGLVPRPQDYVTRDKLKIGAAEFDKISALKGLRMVVLPTDAPGPGELVDSSDGRFGPSYTVRYKSGSEWMTIGGATGGLGGYGVNVVDTVMRTPLLGKLVIGTPGVEDQVNLMFEGKRLRGGSNLDGRSTPLTIMFSCSPGMDRSVVRRTLDSLRVTEL